MRWLAVSQALVILALALGAAFYLSWIRLPPNWGPWSDVRLEEPPGMFARMQLNSLSESADACYAVLDRSRLEYRAVADTSVENGCGLPAGVVVERSNVPYSSGFAVTCQMAAALYWYERRVDELASAELGSALVRIDHLGTYACRNVNSASRGRRSQHATANAIDIAAFRLEDGRRISVLDDWGNETAEGRFLEAAHEAACSLFNTVLGPEYNRLHANHFHFDLGRSRICR